MHNKRYVPLDKRGSDIDANAVRQGNIEDGDLRRIVVQPVFGLDATCKHDNAEARSLQSRLEINGNNRFVFQKKYKKYFWSFHCCVLARFAHIYTKLR
jgi:hypothetical protein